MVNVVVVAGTAGTTQSHTWPLLNKNGLTKTGREWEEGLEKQNLCARQVRGGGGGWCATGAKVKVTRQSTVVLALTSRG